MNQELFKKKNTTVNKVALLKNASKNTDGTVPQFYQLLFKSEVSIVLLCQLCSTHYTAISRTVRKALL